MTTLLQAAFARAAALPRAEQDVLAARLTEEDEFDRAIAGSSDKVARLARDALEEDRAGLTEELEPDR